MFLLIREEKNYPVHDLGLDREYSQIMFRLWIIMMDASDTKPVF